MQERLKDIASGKGRDDENFPVGSWLLPRHIRPHVAAFYAFARAADDIADSPFLSSAEKITHLDAFEAALIKPTPPKTIPEEVAALRESLTITGVTAQHGCDLLAAFRQDARKNRYTDWEDLIGYCLLSAAPVGRYMLDLHGEEETPRPLIDGLCNALQILNHLQDCRKDFHHLDRVYIPQQWLQEAQIDVTTLSAPSTSPALRTVLNRMLDGVHSLLHQADQGVDALAHRRLAAETAVVLKLARRLTARLRHQDPLENPVILSKIDFATAMITGPWQIIWRALSNPRRRGRPQSGPTASRRSNRRTHADKKMQIQ